MRLQQPANLAGQHDGFTRQRPQRVAQATLRQAVAIQRRGVEVVDAGLLGRQHRVFCHIIGYGGIEVAQHIAAEAEGGDMNVGIADFALLHGDGHGVSRENEAGECTNDK